MRSERVKSARQPKALNGGITILHLLSPLWRIMDCDILNSIERDTFQLEGEFVALDVGRKKVKDRCGS